MTLEAEPVSPGEALSGKLSGKLIRISQLLYIAVNNISKVLYKLIFFTIL